MLKCQKKRVYVDKAFIAAVASRDNLLTVCSKDMFSLYNLESFQRSSYPFKNSSTCVAIDWADGSESIFLTADSYGAMGVWDLRNPRKPVSVTESGVRLLPEKTTFNTAAISSDGSYLCGGTQAVERKSKRRKKRKRRGSDEDDDDRDYFSGAYMMAWDTRQLSEPLLILDDIHSDDINHMVFQNYSPRLLSCADDGLVCLTDITAPDDDQLVEVFNAESQSNYCGFLGDGVYSFDNMRSHFRAWPLDPGAEEATHEAWKSLSAPKMAKYMLSAARLPGYDPAVCLLSTSAVKCDLRLSLLQPEGSEVVSKRRFFSRETKLDSDAFYAAVVSTPLSTMEDEFGVVVVTKHSVHRFRAKMGSWSDGSVHK